MDKIEACKEMLRKMNNGIVIEVTNIIWSEQVLDAYPDLPTELVLDNLARHTLYELLAYDETESLARTIINGYIDFEMLPELRSAYWSELIHWLEWKILEAPYVCPETGAFVAYKKVLVANYYDAAIVKLLIPEDAKRSSGVTRKCRCDKAVVLDILSPVTGTSRGDLSTVISMADSEFTYTRGETVYSNSEINDQTGFIEEGINFDENRWEDCSSGIHFYMTFDEAVDCELVLNKRLYLHEYFENFEKKS